MDISVAWDYYKRDMMKSLTVIWKETRSFLHRTCRECSVINPTWLISGEGRVGEGEALETAMAIADSADPVHLNSEGYFRLAAGILSYVRRQRSNVSQESNRKRDRSPADLPGRQKDKRRRDDDYEFCRALRGKLAGRSHRGGWTPRGGQAGPMRTGGTCSFSFTSGGSRGGPRGSQRGGRRAGRGRY